MFNKANLATQGKEDIDFRDDEEKEEESHPYLMALNDEIGEIYDSNLSYSSDYDEIDDLYNELNDSLVKANKDFKKIILLKMLCCMRKSSN